MGSAVTDDDAALHAANLAGLQVLLARAGGWPYEQGDGWTATDGALASRFFSFCVLTSRDRRPPDPRPTVYDGRPGPTGWVVMDTWGRSVEGADVRTPALMRREPAPLPLPLGPAVVARTPDELRTAERALAVGLEAPGLAGARVLGDGLLDAPVAVAYAALRGLPSSCAVAHDDGTTLGVYLVGTATAARGRGLATAVTAAALAALPDRPALLTSTTVGRPVYERLGFRVVGRATMLLRERE